MAEKQYEFKVALKRIQQEGTLAWEYNPFRNYRLDEDMIYYKNQFYSIENFTKKYLLDLINENTKPDDVEIVEIDHDSGFIKVILKDNKISHLISNWDSKFPKTEEIPVVYQKGQLVDFIVDEDNLDFDLNHPVQITPSYSYDNSIDLIINDGNSSPKLINSRFSALGKNKYKIVDRTGNNDTNIYDKGVQFNIDTSLYKITSSIPKITFGGQSYGGNLKIGNYFFYFKYSDLDGNESDFVAESGLVSVFLGNTPQSINQGYRNQNSSKKVRFIFSNISEAYDYIIVYYSRASSEEFQNRTTEYAKISRKYKISRYDNTIIDITGFEEIEEVTFEDINQRLQIYDSAKTQAISQNMLFLGNTTQSYQNHETLSKLSLYIIPKINDKRTCDIDKLNNFYNGDTSNTYYNPNFIYNYTGYWDDELYRFGVVYIRKNNTLTPVYNVRGLYLQESIDYKPYDEDRPISFDETNFNIDSDFIISKNYKKLENAKGVCYIPTQDKLTTVIGLTFKCEDAVIKKLDEELGIKGFFIVRQKRIPTTLCQAYTIGVESESHTPMLPVDSSDNYIYESFLNKDKKGYNYWDDGKKKSAEGYLLSNTFSQHKRTAPKGTVTPTGAICPDYDVNTPYLNSLFTGSEFTVIPYYANQYLKSGGNERLFISDTIEKKSGGYNNVKIIGVEDNVKLVGIGDDLFSARAGEAEEPYRFAAVGAEYKKDHGGNNLLRGSYGTYLGISGYKSAGDLITIKIPGYNPSNLLDYFKIRYFDASMFYPISDRITFDQLNESETIKNVTVKILGTFYRGDCYICKFTHRLNRNFRDATTPTNDSIVDPSCWTHNISYEDNVLKKDNLDKINLGDVNAVNLGMWVSFIVRSGINHSVRGLNEQNVDETQLIGNCRGFYPYHPLSAKAAYKLPESGTYNKGFEASVSERIYEELPIVPYYKDTFATRIAYSNLQITSAFQNAYRVFPANHYRDYPITYGEITKIIEYNGDLMCILEHGIYKIPVNERAVAGEGSGGPVFINTSNVLPENPIVISDTFGSQWIDSIIKTPVGIYGVDTVAKKIWKVDNNGIELISDYKVQEFLNNNISLTERELTPIIGIRNVKTHYNAFKHDVMFTFYDDLHGANEVAWNLCWNELQNKWITFYSWIPSFSENIYNQYFSFDRETSKQIAKLAINQKSEWHDMIYLDDTVITKEQKSKKDENNNELLPTNYIGTIHYDLKGATFEWKLVNDVYNNKNKFTLNESNGNLTYNDSYSDYAYTIENVDNITLDGKQYFVVNKKWCTKNDPNQAESDSNKEYNDVEDTLTISQLNSKREQEWKQRLETGEYIDSNGNKETITQKKVYYLTIRVTPTFTYQGKNATYAEYIANKNANSQLTGGYIERTIAVIPKEHLDALSTDFWKHGQSGIIDIKEEIKPTMWYGKQHPFEFEFIVRDQPDTHKIFDNLILISNKAEPESFHYEIVGECYEFAKDKENMYIRQEATKELFQLNGYNISYNDNYKECHANQRFNTEGDFYEKSTIFPQYYFRQDAVNTIEDHYHNRPEETNGKDFAYLSGSEIVYYKTLNEFRIWTHIKGEDITKTNTLLKGNMHYKEDKWYVQIPSMNYVQRNEPKWKGTVPPIELQQSNFVRAKTIEIPKDMEYNNKEIDLWSDDQIREQEAKIKDKYVKIRIRYKGDNLAIISAIKTLYSISYA